MLSVLRRRGVSFTTSWSVFSVSGNSHCLGSSRARLAAASHAASASYASSVLCTRRFVSTDNMELESDIPQASAASIEQVPATVDAAADSQEAAVASAADAAPQEGAEGAEEARDDDPLAYTRRGEFTSQLYRISIKNLRKFPGFRGMVDWMRDHSGVVPHRVYTQGMNRNMLIYATFKTKEDQETTIAKLNGLFYKGEKIACVPERPQKDPFAEKRGKRSREGEQSSAKRAKHMDPAMQGLSAEERITRAIEPLKLLPYEQQLQRKQDWVSHELKQITSLLSRNTLVPPWLPKQKAANNGHVCELLDILESPTKGAYRIKNEFSIGPGPESSPDVTVGFRLGMYKEGCVTIVSPEQCSIVPESARHVAKVFQDFIRQSEIQYFDEYTHLGYWQTLTVRTPVAGGCMAVAQMQPQKLTEVEVETEIEEMRKYFVDGPGKDSGITSMYLNFNLDRYKANLKSYYHVFGETHLHEKLLGLTYRISPDSFFQVNTAATERLYTTICDWCDVGEDSVVLDICCGTGTIALALAKKVKKVIGIEMCEQAVEDAKHNAELNGITNAEFICGRAEHVISSVVKRFGRHTKLVAVVDPPRPGLHPDVCTAIRKCSALKRLVFVACNLKQSKDNIIFLSKPPNNHVHHQGFRPVRAVTVDMFPHTPHCEVAMLLERVPPAKLSDFVDKPKSTASTSTTSTTTVEPETKVEASSS